MAVGLAHRINLFALYLKVRRLHVRELDLSGTRGRGRQKLALESVKVSEVTPEPEPWGHTTHFLP